LIQGDNGVEARVLPFTNHLWGPVLIEPIKEQDFSLFVSQALI